MSGVSAMSRRKGVSGELAVAKLFTEHGYAARRSQQHLGAPDAPDVIVDECPWLAIEVKNRETHNFWDAMAKAHGSASDAQMPVVFAKRNRKPWLVTMEPETFFTLLRAILTAQEHYTEDGIARHPAIVERDLWPCRGGFVEHTSGTVPHNLCWECNRPLADHYNEPPKEDAP